jgi:hypothetical protein
MKLNKHAFSILAPLSLCLVVEAASADAVSARFPQYARHPDNVFTRMFADLPPFSRQTDNARKAVQLMGARHGVLDADDNLTDPVQSITNPAVFSPHNPDNPAMSPGMTFLGQFLDHDVTFDKRSRLNANASPGHTVNFRTAAFDLDSVYGDGPDRSPALYERSSGRIKFILQPIPGAEAVSRHGAVRFDVPRDAAGAAIVAERRNDENVVIAQMQVALLAFHNAVTDQLAAQPVAANVRRAASSTGRPSSILATATCATTSASTASCPRCCWPCRDRGRRRPGCRATACGRCRHAPCRATSISAFRQARRLPARCSCPRSRRRP